MISRSFLAVAVTALAATSAASTHSVADEAHRELGAHEHGHSTLNIAIEGGRIEMALEAPGADIVGFEHAARSTEDKMSVEQAEAALKEPLALFVLPNAAGCTVENASVEIEGEGADGHGDDHAAHEDAAHEEDHHAEAAHDEHEDGAGHNEFHAAYALACADPAQIDGIDFAFFDIFAGAQEVEVTVITENGQSSFEVERDQPRIELQGLM